MTKKKMTKKEWMTTPIKDLPEPDRSRLLESWYREVEEAERLWFTQEDKDRERITKHWKKIRFNLLRAEATLRELRKEKESWPEGELFPIEVDTMNRLRDMGMRFHRLAKEMTGWPPD